MIKFATYKLILIIFFCVCRWFSQNNHKFFKIFLISLWLVTLSEWQIILWETNFLLSFNFWFLYSRGGFLWRMDKKSDFLTSSCFKSIDQIFLESNVETNRGSLWICGCTCTHSLPCNCKDYSSMIVMYVQQMQPWSHSLWIWFVFLEHYINFETLQQTLSTVNPYFLGTLSFVIMVENTLTVSSKSFVSNPFESTVRSNKSWRTIKYFTSLFLPYSSSRKARFIH